MITQAELEERRDRIESQIKRLEGAVDVCHELWEDTEDTRYLDIASDLLWRIQERRRAGLSLERP